jgi:hypothetical protein
MAMGSLFARAQREGPDPRRGARETASHAASPHNRARATEALLAYPESSHRVLPNGQRVQLGLNGSGLHGRARDSFSPSRFKPKKRTVGAQRYRLEYRCALWDDQNTIGPLQRCGVLVVPSTPHPKHEQWLTNAETGDPSLRSAPGYCRGRYQIVLA